MKRFNAAMDAVWELLLIASVLAVCVLGFVAYGSPLWGAEPISVVQSSPMGFPCSAAERSMILGTSVAGEPRLKDEAIERIQSLQDRLSKHSTGSVSLFPCDENQNGWLVVVKGDAAAYRGVLKYRDVDGNEQTETVVAATVLLDQVEPEKRGSYASLAFRLGRFLPSSDFLGVEVTALREAEKITIP